MKRSQRANRAVVEIREICTINYNATEYLYRKGVRIEEIVRTGILYRVHYNLEKI